MIEHYLPNNNENARVLILQIFFASKQAPNQKLRSHIWFDIGATTQRSTWKLGLTFILVPRLRRCQSVVRSAPGGQYPISHHVQVGCVANRDPWELVAPVRVCDYAVSSGERTSPGEQWRSLLDVILGACPRLVWENIKGLIGCLNQTIFASFVSFNSFLCRVWFPVSHVLPVSFHSVALHHPARLRLLRAWLVAKGSASRDGVAVQALFSHDKTMHFAVFGCLCCWSSTKRDRVWLHACIKVLSV